MLLAEFKFIMFFVWAAAMALACWAWEVARMFARRMEKEAARRAGTWEEESHTPIERWPAAAVVLPIKGMDAETEANVRALLAQDYPAHRLLFAVESAEDPVVALLARLASASSVNAETIVAGIATERGQKIQNQLAAVARTGAADEVLVFMDADAHPAPDWLRQMIRPLAEQGPQGAIGATTGFRFYVPERPGRSVADAMASVINAAVAALLGPGWRNIAWGGSMAVWRENFYAFGIDKAWNHALSDDYVLSWCVKNQAKRKIQFVQGCLVASEAAFTWRTFWEFAARQYRITRVCAPAVWLTAVGAASLYLVALAYTGIFFVLSLAGVGAGSVMGRVDFPLLIMFAALYIANFLRGRFLLLGGMAGLPEEAGRLRAIGFWYTWGYPVTLLVNLLALLKSAFGRTVEWRGVRYVMHGLRETTVRRDGAK